MKFAVRQLTDRAHREPITHRCGVCHETALVLERRHVSPERLGKAVVTEYYECDCCDTRYTYSPAHNRWRRLSV
jgi:hypothetical protein